MLVLLFFILELYKNENARRQEINKLKSDHDTGGGFVPKQFKSSRSTQQQSNIKSQREKNDYMHEKAIFSNDQVDAKPLAKANESSDDPGKKNDTSLMHENVAIFYIRFHFSNNIIMMFKIKNSYSKIRQLEKKDGD